MFVITFIAALWFIWLSVKLKIFRARERARGAGMSSVDKNGTKRSSDKFFELFGSKKDNEGGSGQRPASRREMTKRLQDAGLESAVEQGKFFVLKAVCYVTAPCIGGATYLWFTTYYATISTIFATATGVIIPYLWLKARTDARTEEIQRELPLLIDLTNLGTSAGWDVAASLERVIDALTPDYPNHPLIKEFRKARWLAASGYTWYEALDRLGDRLGNDAVKRCTLALGQAMKQGGDRTSQLEGVANDAQRIYYGQIDRRLAALPVKALIVTMVLMISYFAVVMAPAAVQIKTTVMH